MKQFILLSLVIALFFSCENIDEKQPANFQISDGCYQGYFDFQDTSYWCSICLENGEYAEWPSGGVMFQKSMGCLTVGTFSTDNASLSFELGSFKFKDFPEPCTTEMLLPGKFEITYSNSQDSLVFKRGTGEKQIIYYLKKHSSGD